MTTNATDINSTNPTELTRLLEEWHRKLEEKNNNLEAAAETAITEHSKTTLSEGDYLKLIENKLTQHYALEARMCYLIHNRIYELQNLIDTDGYFASRNIITDTITAIKKRIKRIIQAVSM